jgi:hypothetical protein
MSSESRPPEEPIMGAGDLEGSGPTRAEAGAGGSTDRAPEELEREVQRLRAWIAALQQERPSRHRVRQTIGAVLAVLTVISVIATTVAVWQTRTAFATDRFMTLVQPVLASPDVYDAISIRLTDETLEVLALEDRVEAALGELGQTLRDELAQALGVTEAQRARIQLLPIPQLQDLAAPIAGGLEARVAARIDRFVTSPEFERLLVEGTEVAHTKAVALLRGDEAALPNLEVATGEVRLNLVPVVGRVLEDLVDEGLAVLGIEEIPFLDPFADPQLSLDRLSSALGTELPSDFGQLTVMSEAELEELQTVARRLDQLVWVLLVLSIVLLVATLAVAPRRRRMLAQVGLGTAAGTVLTMLLVRSTEDDIAATAVTAPGRRAVTMLAEATFDSLRSVMVVVLVVALVVALMAHLAGRPAWLMGSIAWVRRVTAARGADDQDADDQEADDRHRGGTGFSPRGGDGLSPASQHHRASRGATSAVAPPREDAAMSDAGMLLETLGEMTAVSLERVDLDARELMLVRLAALAAVDAPAASYLLNLGAAAEAGLTLEDAQSVLIATAPIIGAPRSVVAATNLADALGFALLEIEIEMAIEEALEEDEG